MSWYRFFRPLAFALPPETAHTFAVTACKYAGRSRWLAETIGSDPAGDPRLAGEVAGIHFPNPIGLGAGWDKNAEAIRFLQHSGFGSLEVGSISSRPSSGNPRPRLFRLPAEQAIVVNYGLPNDGAEAIRNRLTSVSLRVPLGINLVKTNDGPDAPPADVAEILADYRRSAERLHDAADYLTLNLSCPNACGGKEFFAERGSVHALLSELSGLGITCPVFLKVRPDPGDEAIDRLLEESVPFDFVRGMIFNLPPGKPTTLCWRGSPEIGRMPGAVAGLPVRQLIDRCITTMHRRMPPGRFAIIGGGGVFSAEDAYAKIRLGASLVQIYSSFVYEGPAVVRRINHGLARLLERDGFANVSDAVGVDARSC